MKNKTIRTKEYREKMSKSKKGKVSNHKGKKHTEEAKILIGLFNKGKKRECVSGSKSNFWKGGISTLQSTIRSSFNYRQWRSDVYTRDNYICQKCGQRGGNLNADHIQPFALILKENNIKNLDEAINCDELFNLNNGQTLCINCHKKTDSYLNNYIKNYGL